MTTHIKTAQTPSSHKEAQWTPDMLTALAKGAQAAQEGADKGVGQPKPKAESAHTPDRILNDSIDYIRSLKQTQAGYANKVQDALDAMAAERDKLREQVKTLVATCKCLTDELRHGQNVRSVFLNYSTGAIQAEVLEWGAIKLAQLTRDDCEVDYSESFSEWLDEVRKRNEERGLEQDAFTYSENEARRMEQSE